MKKFFALLLAICFIATCLCACGSSDDVNNMQNSSDSEQEYISLTLSNCKYYLSIDDTLISSSSVTVSVGTFNSYSRKITINGAVSGLYSDCSITFEYGESKAQNVLELNAAGFGTFEYNINNSNYKAKVISCKGKIYI